MAHFYGSMAGSAKTEATRCGTKNSGMNAHVRGWNCGIETFVDYDATNDKESYSVYMTGGSNGSRAPKALAQVRYDPASDTRMVRVFDGNGNTVAEYVL
jgi:hypothetical protein